MTEKLSGECSLTISLRFGDPFPKPGRFVVTVGKKGIGSVYHILEARKVGGFITYKLRCLRAPDMKAKTRIDPTTGLALIDGESEVITMVWNKR